jgi:hypothetical protein
MVGLATLSHSLDRGNDVLVPQHDEVHYQRLPRIRTQSSPAIPIQQQPTEIACKTLGLDRVTRRDLGYEADEVSKRGRRVGSVVGRGGGG